MSVQVLRGEFPRSVYLHPLAGGSLNGIINTGTLPGVDIAQGGQLYINWSPRSTDPSVPEGTRAANVSVWTGNAFRILDLSAIANLGFDASGVLLSAIVGFEVKDAQGGAHTYQLDAEYVSGDAMAYTVAAQSIAD